MGEEGVVVVVIAVVIVVVVKVLVGVVVDGVGMTHYWDGVLI